MGAGVSEVGAGGGRGQLGWVRVGSEMGWQQGAGGGCLGGCGWGQRWGGSREREGAAWVGVGGVGGGVAAGSGSSGVAEARVQPSVATVSQRMKGPESEMMRAVFQCCAWRIHENGRFEQGGTGQDWGTCGSWVLGPGSWVLGPGAWGLGPGAWGM